MKVYRYAGLFISSIVLKVDDFYLYLALRPLQFIYLSYELRR